MPIQIEEDFDQPDGGFVILTLPHSIGDDDGSLRIRRLAGEPDKLGPNGWQPHDTTVKPVTVRDTGGKTALYFGPELTQHLIEQTEVEISVLALKTTERVVWPYITPSVDADGGRGSVAGPAPIAEVTTRVAVPAPQQDQSATLENTGGHAPFGDPPNEEPPVVDPPEDEDKGFNWWWLVPIVVVSAVIVFFVVPFEQFLTPQDEETTQATVVSEASDTTETEEAIEATQIVPEPEPDQVTAPVDTRDSLMAEAVACRSTGCGGDAYFDLANRLDGIGVTDLFAIMGLAADNGSVPAMDWLARSYDPLHFQENEGLSHPDPSSAFLYYAQAKDAGSAEAGAATEALCAALATPEDAAWNVKPTSDEIRSAFEGNCQ